MKIFKKHQNTKPRNNIYGQRTFWNDVSKFLIIKLLIPFIVGILLQYHIQPNVHVIWTGAILSAGLMYLAYGKIRRMSYYRILFGSATFMCFMFLGAGTADLRHPQMIDPKEIIGKSFCAVVTNQPEEKPKSWKSQLTILDSTGNESFEILAYFQKDSLKPPPQIGDLIALSSNLQRINNSTSSPTDFNYADYMAKQGVYYQTYIKSDSYTLIDSSYKTNLRYYGCKIRTKLINIYRNFDFNDKELAVLEALTLGYKSDLDEDTKSAFQSSGAMHVLAVSGLHTGIIMLITDLLLRFMNRTRRERIIKCVIVLSVIWLFAAVTGFSSSVNRAALMFSIMSIGNATGRNTTTYNSIALSCFILLFINPYLIFNVGFGLSYMAVLSIVSFNPLFQSVEYSIKNPVLKYFVGIGLVSIAAQIGTSVLSICTFGQFPMYFLLTNIIVIPVAYVIMILAIALLISSPVYWLGYAVFWLLKKALSFLVWSVSWIETLPGSCITDIVLNNYNAILIYAIILSLVVFIYYKRFVWVKISVACLLIISVLSIIKTITA